MDKSTLDSNFKGNKLYKSTILGSLSGGLGYICTLPLDAIKQNIQVNYIR